VKVKTLHGGKIKGKLFIADENQIMIKNILIPVSNIEKIKRNPLALNVLVSGTLFIIGGYGVLGGKFCQPVQRIYKRYSLCSYGGFGRKV